MRSTLRLFAKVKPTRYLEPFAPTGLTGLQTHPSPRSTLIYLYTTTLEKLRAFPESSAYRQSTEALTRHRLQIIEETKPPGFEEWLARVKETVAAEPNRFAPLRRPDGTFAGRQQDDGSADPRGHEWDGEGLEPTIEGPARTPEEEARFQSIMDEVSQDAPKDSDFETEVLKWENEPALEADQIHEIEQKIGGGLIEEVVQVAEGELKLVDEMAKAKIWEELTEKPHPGQWVYFERDTHSPADR